MAKSYGCAKGKGWQPRCSWTKSLGSVSGSKKTILFGLVCGAVGAAAAAALLNANAHDETTNAVQGELEDAGALDKPEDAGVTPPPAPPKKPLRRRLVNSRSQALAMEQLQALGYVDGTVDPDFELADVVTHIKEAAHQGYNFYSSRRDSGARLIDMQGQLVHEWRTSRKGQWQHAELLRNGDVIVIVKDKRLTRYDKDSNEIWSIDGRFHHDLWIVDDEIYVLSRVAKKQEYVHPASTVVVDLIEVRSIEDGALKRRISIPETLDKSDYAFLLPSIAHYRTTSKKNELDILHTNHVEVFDGWLAHRHPIYAKGNILISMRNINTIAILDGHTLEVLWVWGPTNLTYQHHPTLLKNGNILLFDNGSKQSRVIEIDPLSGRIVWWYKPGDSFFSATRGSNQRLPNGNTLITESDTGYVLEVSPKREVVWKFANPKVNRKKEREAIWRMTRVDPDSLTFLQ